MNGPEHYREGERHLSAASFVDKPGGKPVDPSGALRHTMTAQAHFTAAQAAATAAQLADRYVGDGEHISDWRKAISGADQEPSDDPWAATPKPYIPGQPYSPPVETALRNLNLAGYVTPADTLISAVSAIAFFPSSGGLSILLFLILNSPNWPWVRRSSGSRDLVIAEFA